MDWNAAGPWKIEDLEGNSLIVNTDLELAYYKATSLLYEFSQLREVSLDEYEIVLGDGIVINTIERLIGFGWRWNTKAGGGGDVSLGFMSSWLTSDGLKEQTEVLMVLSGPF
ncbi:MAG TPA: hypothetical protein VGK23_02390 [Methanomassiliicoccales archaeon]|jgi:hypothetical protein